MPATAPNRWGGRFCLPILALSALSAGLAQETPKDQFESLAQALQDGDAKAAISVFDSKMKDFAEIKRDLEALSSLPHTTAQIQLGSANGNRFETKWTLQLTTRENGPQLIRTENVSIEMGQVQGEWKIEALSPLSVLARPDPAVFNRIASLANSLSENDGPGAASIFDSGMDKYGEISNNIDALVTQTEVLCAIDMLEDNESGGVHTLDTDWYLQLKSRADGGPTERRRERVQLQMRLLKGKWRITGIAPSDVLLPIKAN